MRKIFLISFLCSTQAFSLGGSSPNRPVPPGSNFENRTDWQNVYSEENFSSNGHCLIEVSQTIQVAAGETYDGGGCLHRWIGTNSNNCHRATVPTFNFDQAMFNMAPNSTIQNLEMECAMDGIHSNNNTIIENVVNRDCENSCITVQGNGVILRNNQFFLCQKECIKLSNTSNVEIVGNYFAHATTPIGVFGNNSPSNVTLYQNDCLNCDVMVYAANSASLSNFASIMNTGTCMMQTTNSSVIYDLVRNESRQAELVCAAGTQNIQ